MKDKQYKIISEGELDNFLKLNSTERFIRRIMQYKSPATKLIDYIVEGISNKLFIGNIDEIKFILKNFKYIKFEGIYTITKKEDRKFVTYLDYYDGYYITIYLYLFTLCFKY